MVSSKCQMDKSNSEMNEVKPIDSSRESEAIQNLNERTSLQSYLGRAH